MDHDDKIRKGFGQKRLTVTDLKINIIWTSGLLIIDHIWCAGGIAAGL